MKSLTKQGFAFHQWSQKNPIGKIPQSVAREGAGENRIPFTHYANSVPVYLIFRDILLESTKKNASILDVGCGTGRNISFVKETIKRAGFRFFGIDYSQGCISYAQSQYKKQGVIFIQHQGKEFPYPDESFDYLVSSHVLEHIPKNEAQIYVHEIARVLKKDGIAVIGTPNRAYCQDLFCKNPQDEKKYRLILPHLHEYYEKELKTLFTKKKLFKTTSLIQTTNALCRELMTQGSKKIQPGNSIVQRLIFEFYSILRQNSIVQDIMAKLGSEFLIKKMKFSYSDLLQATTVDHKNVDRGDNFIIIAKK